MVEKNTNITYTGVMYVAQLESDYMNARNLGWCNTCFVSASDQPLRRCIGCKHIQYCSKECQKKQWSKHKNFCNLCQCKGAKNAYLSACTRNEALQKIIDSYRLRVETDHDHRDEDHGIYYPGKWEEGIVWFQGDVVEDFQRYLDLAEATGILPDWWSFEARMECLGMAIDPGNDENIHKKLHQYQLIARYGGDTTIRDILAILAELVVGYEGKGAPLDNTWFSVFQKYLDSHPEERARLNQDAINILKASYTRHGREFPK